MRALDRLRKGLGRARYHLMECACGLLLLLLLAPAAWGALPAAVDGDAVPSLAPMLQRITPAVVNISTRSTVRTRRSPLLSDPFFRRFFDIPDQPQERRTESLGSGVVVDAQRGFVVTNHHVVDKADQITVTLRDRRQLEAVLVGTDPETDIAIVKVPPEGLTALPLADSDKLRVGDFAVAIGNPFGLGQTVTSGIVSALGRTGLGIEGYEDFIQTDASINPGNSGGALVSLRGELVGINTAIFAPSGGNVGIGFAIPSNMVRDVMEQLVKYGEVRRGQLGVVVQDLTPALAAAFDLPARQGAVVVSVTQDSPAGEAGLRPGDIVVSLNGREVRSSADMRNTVGLLPVGEEVRMDILRGGEPLAVATRIAEPVANALAGKELHPRLAGAVFGTRQVAGNGRAGGVAVLEVEAGSAAWRSGLRGGDVILGVNRGQVNGLAEFAQAVRASPHSLMLNMRRGSSSVYVLIQ